MNYTFEKDKNFVKFFVDGSTTPYVFNLNTMVFLGKSGKTLTKFPNGFISWAKHFPIDDTTPNFMRMFNQVFRDDFSRKYFDTWNVTTSLPTSKMEKLKDIFAMADKLDAIGYRIVRWELSEDKYYAFITNNFKTFVKEFKANPQLTIADFYREYAQKQFFENAKISADLHLTDEMKKAIFSNKNRFPIEKCNLVAYYLSHGLWEFFSKGNDVDDGYRGTFGNSSHSYVDTNAIFDKIDTYFFLCEKVGMKPEKDLFKHFAVVKKTYAMNKKSIDNSTLEDIAKSYEWLTSLNNENFTIVIPKTRKDFADEANAQGNCVYSYYLEKVLRKETMVVFVRRTSCVEKSFITCEIANNGYINQYLYAHNNRVYDETSAEYLFQSIIANALANHKGE